MNIKRTASLLFAIFLITQSSQAKTLIQGFSQKKESTGTLKGVIFDSNGYRVANVNLTIDDKKTKREIRTDGTGEYQIKLPKGTYKVTIDQWGFCRYEHKGVKVELGATRNMDIHLKILPCNRS